MKRKQFQFYPFLLASFPVLSLMANNKFEVRLVVVVRPLIISIVLALFLYLFFFVLFKKDFHKAALMTGLTQFLIFSYGHIFNLLDTSPFLNESLVRHRYVVLLFGLMWLAVLMVSFFREINADFSKLMNIFSIVLVVIPLLQIIWFYFGELMISNWAKQNQQENSNYVKEINYSPDVYYIILDMYARPDVLLEEHGIDVRDFIDEMEALGFYYADESQSNYGETFTSISSTLNLKLLDEYLPENDIPLGGSKYEDLIIHSETRRIFESYEYQIIAFSTGYRWSELSDADIFYQIESTNYLKDLTPFELLLFKTTIIYPFRGHLFNLLPTLDIDAGGADTTQNLHIEAQRNVLERLPEIPENTNPTFTFAHVLIPHPPFVFDADGSILQDPGYYSGEKASAINDVYDLDGYRRQVKFISQKILSISKEILKRSDDPPIIVIQADHGWKDEDRHKILNLYYFPGENYEMLYPSITPVNTFRVIFNQYFILDFDLVEDRILQQ